MLKLDVWGVPSPPGPLAAVEHTITAPDQRRPVRRFLAQAAGTHHDGGCAGDGPGEWSREKPPRSHCTPKTTPDVPIISLITPDGSTLTVALDAPANTGGSAITSYDLRYIESGAIDKADANWTEVVPAWSTGPLVR